MGESIHCRQDDDGTYRFRIWGSTVDSYLTTDLTEEEVHRYVRQRGMESALSTFEIDRGIERAKSVGSSDYYTTKPASPLSQPWRKERITHEEATNATDLSDMFFLLAHEKYIDNDEEDTIFEGPFLLERMKTDTVEPNQRIFSPKTVESFEAWADLSCFGEVFRGEGFQIVRVLPPK